MPLRRTIHIACIWINSRKYRFTGRGSTTVAVSIELVKELRERTGAGIKECRDILEQTGGDINKAIEILRERGIEAAAKKASREANEGLIGVYVHYGSRIAAMVELSCETDFVARTAEFGQLANDLAQHIVALNPRFISVNEVTDEMIAESGQSRQAFIEETVLLEQKFIKDPARTIEEKIKEAIAKLGENIVVRRFIRYEVGA
ncbi:MAG TPA: translation elongation factor Ts [Chloroflexus aurantiacus]|uniref:Elongation factor Ts n=1 Tax=Chloroflexus aurantiacus (strain ATCC 29366 / DSM 635 / J-10-fl) TaxID=324602 RepID=A9WAG0_CHLAA|nr:translation elongation factor Ts [Chloroflexus aurantiacus]ABY36750.1 Translation elongation factor EFTs/EF1B dimerisation [Chloroflexus aurantiacus J-10-fl]RMG50002.1 MAG: translation elongation factor Ts [Chloroflexota bacterium]HBW65692.1 translation elongation factor Ts [Chloroflexus aurantiacus]